MRLKSKLVTAVQEEASFANRNQYGGSRTRKNKRATVVRLENKYDDGSARKKMAAGNGSCKAATQQELVCKWPAFQLASFPKQGMEELFFTLRDRLTSLDLHKNVIFYRPRR